MLLACNVCVDAFNKTTVVFCAYCNTIIKAAMPMAIVIMSAPPVDTASLPSGPGAAAESSSDGADESADGDEEASFTSSIASSTADS